jgi:hypothetical protein
VKWFTPPPRHLETEVRVARVASATERGWECNRVAAALSESPGYFGFPVDRNPLQSFLSRSFQAHQAGAIVSWHRLLVSRRNTFTQAVVAAICWESIFWNTVSCSYSFAHRWKAFRLEIVRSDQRACENALRKSPMSVLFGTRIWSRRAVSKVCAVCERGIFRRAGRMLAVEFPSPCDGTSLNWQFVFGGLDKENRAPSKECNLYRPESFSKDEPPRSPYHRSVRAPTA